MGSYIRYKAIFKCNYYSVVSFNIRNNLNCNVFFFLLEREGEIEVGGWSKGEKKW